MGTLYAAPTRALDLAFLASIKTLLGSAFEGDFTDDDWNSTVGGDHVWMADGDEIVSHAAVVERTLICSGVTLRVGYVEAVATRADRRRRGYASAIMRYVATLIRERYTLGALSTGEHAFYERVGWERWLGATFVNTPSGRQRTADDDGSIMILRTPRTPRLDREGEIVCEWRAGDVW